MVIAIIAIRDRMLRPALSRAEQKALVTSCINHNHQLMVTSQMDAEDNAGRPWFTFVVRGANVDRRLWFNLLAPYCRTTNLSLSPLSPGS